MARFKLDHRGVGRILKSTDIRKPIDRVAERIAARIHAEHPEIEPGVHSYTTDRAAASVSVANGAALQATSGIFTRAASAEGLEVSDR